MVHPRFLALSRSAARVAASVRESLARLQLSYVDLIQCHDIEFTQLDQARGRLLPGAWHLCPLCAGPGLALPAACPCPCPCRWTMQGSACCLAPVPACAPLHQCAGSQKGHSGQ